MASPVINPRPARSIAGPVVLILVGVLFLMMTLGVLDRFSLVHLYGRYWPAVLILWGVIKLIEHEQSKRSGLPSRGIGAGGVLRPGLSDSLRHVRDPGVTLQLG